MSSIQIGSKVKVISGGRYLGKEGIVKSVLMDSATIEGSFPRSRNKTAQEFLLTTLKVLETPLQVAKADLAEVKAEITEEFMQIPAPLRNIEKTLDLKPQGGQHTHSTPMPTKADDAERAEGEQGSDPTSAGSPVASAAARSLPDSTATAMSLSGSQVDGSFGVKTEEPVQRGLLGNKLASKFAPSGDTSSHLIVKARAGTGKTTTLIHGVRRVLGLQSDLIPSPQQQAVWDAMEQSKGKVKTIGFCAFNKSIATELQTRLPQGCEAATLHSLGFKVVKKAFGAVVSVNQYRVQNLIGEITGRDVYDLRREKPALIRVVEKLVSLAKMNLIDPNDEELMGLVAHHDIDVEGCNLNEAFPLVSAVVERCKDVRKDNSIDYDDMIWLPVVLNLPVVAFDMLLVDECFPAGTMVPTDRGVVPIEKIASEPGTWQVLSVDTESKIRYTSVLKAYKTPHHNSLVRIDHAEGSITCTGNHPIWITGFGWKPAGLVASGDSVPILRKTDTGSTTVLLAPMRETAGSEESRPDQGTSKAAEDFPSHGGRPHGDTQSDVAPGDQGQSVGHAQGAGYPTVDPGRQRNWLYKAASVAVASVGPSAAKLALEPRTCRTEWSTQDGSTNELQNRHRVDQTQDRGGSGRCEPQSARSQGSGREEGYVLVQSRVVCVSIVEQGGVGESGSSGEVDHRNVYTLQTEAGNYFADDMLVKNCQDLNRCQQALAKKYGKRLIGCGDDRQAIYGFAGADSEAMKRMFEELSETERGCVELPLTVTRRCGKAIVAKAQEIVPDFEAFESNPDGLVSAAQYPNRKNGITPEKSFMSKTADGDMVLCRCNAPLVSTCFKFLRMGRKAQIQGRDIGQGLISTIKKQKAASVVDLQGKLDRWLHQETSKENAKRNPSEDKLIMLGDRYDCLVMFMENAETVEDVIRKIESVFTDQRNGAGVKLSSIHRSKGLEADRVFLLQLKKARAPHPMAKTQWAKEQEMNLLYVATTRAIHELVIVTGDDEER